MKLILHIGMGKTGTTAFQSFCDLNRKALMRAGYIYAGRELQNLIIRHPWKGRGIKKGINGEELRGKLEFIESVMRSRFYKGKKALIWSNEDFSMSHSPDEIIFTLDEYVKYSCVFDNWEVYLVLRRQDQWIESAYKQWALKHKTYSGKRIQTPSEFISSHLHLLDYYELASKWSRSSARLHVCSYDSVIKKGGIERYLVERMRLKLSAEELMSIDRVNESMSNEASIIAAIYNSRFEEENYPSELIVLLQKRLVDNREGRSCFVSYDERSRIYTEYKKDNKRVEGTFFSDNEEFSKLPVDSFQLFEPDYVRLGGYFVDLLLEEKGCCGFRRWKKKFERFFLVFCNR